MSMDRRNLSPWQAAIDQFNSVGVCHLPAFLEPELINSLGAECDRLRGQQVRLTANNLRIGLREDRNGNPVLDRLDPVADLSDLFNSLNQHPRILSLVAAVLGEAVLVMKEKLIFKMPGTGGFGFHRDEAYFAASGASGTEMVTVAVSLDDTTEDSGPVQFYPKLRNLSLRAPAGEPRDVDASEKSGHQPFTPLPVRGDILLFDGRIPHCSAFNLSSHPRRIYMITYIPARYPQGRDNYYRQRILEQAGERAGLVDGELLFQ